MNALYAFNRITDDIGDEEDVPVELRRAQLVTWRETLRRALDPDAASDSVFDIKQSQAIELFDHPAMPAIVDTVKRCQIPPKYVFAVIDGVEMDLYPFEISNFSDLEQYCYHVAGAVGLCCIHVWGFNNQAAIPLAIECGMALQLTNILRDLTEDFSAGRVYLPDEDFERFQYSKTDLAAKTLNESFSNLMQFEVERTKSYYARAELLFEHLEPCGRPILRTMLDIYGGILREIERRKFDVFSDRVSIPKWKKLWFAGRAMLSSGKR
jgi:phytoene synthase